MFMVSKQINSILSNVKFGIHINLQLGQRNSEGI